MPFSFQPVMAVDFTIQIESSTSEVTPTHIVVSGPLISSVIRKNLIHSHSHIPGLEEKPRRDVVKYEGGSWWARIRKFAQDANVNLTQDSTFMSCGMSSSDAVRCSYLLSKIVGRALPATLCFDYKTMRDVIAAFSSSPADAIAALGSSPADASPTKPSLPGQHPALTSFHRFKSRRMKARRRIWSIADLANSSFV